MSGSAGNRTFEIRITGDASGVQRALQGAAGAADQASKRIQGSATEAGRGLNALGAAGRAAEQALGPLGARASGLGQALSVFGPAGRAAAAALGAVGVAAGAAAVAGDAMANSLAKLRNATGSVEAARAVYEQLYRLSLQTGVSVSESVDAFGRFAIAARNIGATNDQVVALVRTLQQAGAVAGTSTQEAAAATMQLGQALASGRLQGDELRSILEAMPSLAEKLARELGVSLGELRKMGEEGKLTADRVFPALLRAGETIRHEFDQMPMTLSRGFGILQEATTRFLADVDQALGMSRRLADGLAAAGRALDGARGRLFATPEEAARARVDAAQAALLDVERRERESLASGRRGNPDAFARQRAAALAEARAAAQELERIEAESLDRRFQENEAAAARARAAQAERDRQEHRLLVERLDNEAKARREHEERMQGLRARLARGSITQEEFNLRERQSLELLAAANREATRAAREAAREAEQAATRRGRVVQSLQVEENARRRELDAVRAGGDARERLNVELELEKQLREAGIPAVENRTAAEQASAEAIERSVRATAALRAEIARHDSATQEARREAERALSEIASTSKRISEDVAEALFDSMTGERRGQSVLDWFRTLFKRIAIQALSANIFLPITAAIVGAVPGLFGIASAGAAAAGGGGVLGSIGGIGQLLGLGNSLSGGGLLNSLGLGNLGGTVSGLLATPLWGNPVAAAGMFAEAPAAALGLSGAQAASMAGITTIGSLLGLATLGFAGGGLLAGLTGGSQVGGGIGGALGAGLGLMVGGPLGALIGGAGGGLLGGMFGGGKGFSGGDVVLGLDSAGLLQVTGAGSKGFDMGETIARVQGEVAQLNQVLKSLGLSISPATSFPTAVAGVVGGGNSMNTTNLRDALFANFQSTGRRFQHDDPRINALLRDNYWLDSTLEMVRRAQSLIQALSEIEAPTAAFDVALKQLEDRFAPLIAEAQALGFGLDALTEAQARQRAEIIRQRDRTLLGVTEGLRIRGLRADGRDAEAALAEFDFRAVDELAQLGQQLQGLGVDAARAAQILDDLRGVQAKERAELAATVGAVGGALGSIGQDILAWLHRMRTTPAGGFSAEEQLLNARAAFDDALARARLDDPEGLRAITGAAEAYLSAYRAARGSAGFGNVRDFVLDSVAGLDAVMQAKLPQPPAAGATTINADPALMAEIASLRQQLAALRAAQEANTEAQQRLYFALPPAVVGARG